MSHPAVDGKMHMGIGHTLALRWVYIGCVVGIHWVYVGFTFGARWVYIGCTLGIHWVYVGHVMGRSRVLGSCSRNYGQGRLSSKRLARLFLIFKFTIFIISAFIIYNKITIAAIATSITWFEHYKLTRSQDSWNQLILLRFLVYQNTALVFTFRSFVRLSHAWHLNFSW